MPTKEKPARLEKLTKHWLKASADERNAFMIWLGDSGELSNARPTETGQSHRSRHPIATGRYLTPTAIDRIRHVMTTRRISYGDVMLELGFSSDDLSLARALAGRASLRLSMVAALETWLSENADI